MKFSFWRRKPDCSHPAVPVDKSIRAKREAEAGMSVTLDALDRRSTIKRKNHIGEDIGKAYLIAHGKA